MFKKLILVMIMVSLASMHSMQYGMLVSALRKSVLVSLSNRVMCTRQMTTDQLKKIVEQQDSDILQRARNSSDFPKKVTGSIVKYPSAKSLDTRIENLQQQLALLKNYRILLNNSEAQLLFKNILDADIFALENQLKELEIQKLY